MNKKINFMREELYEALDALRVSGTMNMYGAPRWLQDQFDLTRMEAVSVWKDWCNKHSLMNHEDNDG